MLADITATGVRQAIAEYDGLGRDVFLQKYGFRRSRGYVLHDGGRTYDSKAICGAAHGFDRPLDGPLVAAEFSGGAASVQWKLEALGFEVTAPATTSSGWTEEERILALDLYLRRGLVGRTDRAVVALSEELNRRAFHPDAGTRENFRNPNGVALKLANFAAIDPSYLGAGMSRHSAGDEETWAEYAGDIDLVRQAVVEIRSTGASTPQPNPTGDVQPVRRAVEAQRTGTYEVVLAEEPIEAQRREADLVLRFAAWLEAPKSRLTTTRSCGRPFAATCSMKQRTDCGRRRAWWDAPRSVWRLANCSTTAASRRSPFSSAFSCRGARATTYSPWSTRSRLTRHGRMVTAHSS